MNSEDLRPTVPVAGESPTLKATVPFTGRPATEGQTLLLGAHVGHHPSGHFTIPGYDILRPIAAGGMGVVYEARQQRPQRRVALKVMKAGAATPEQIRRFEHEAQVLARLQHPGIAQIFEVGVFNTGREAQPFFAMEFIEGNTLLDYANDNELDTRDRLKLLSEICEAVQHAHQKGIIHRDLKPANILVDVSGQPKILDFGIARVMESDSTAGTMHTEEGRIMGTLRYMSPEQARGNPNDVDTRSDIYTLGVIAYELLAGKMPYDFPQAVLHEVIRTICETDPAPLSSISRDLKGDIETIILKALDKDKERRYSSAADLAMDFERYLADEPILARRTSKLYQFGKFMKRNKAITAGVASVFCTLSLGLLGTLWQMDRALKERDERDKAAQQALASLDTAREAIRKVGETENSVSSEMAELRSSLESVRVSNRSLLESVNQKTEENKLPAPIDEPSKADQYVLDEFDGFIEDILSIGRDLSLAKYEIQILQEKLPAEFADGESLAKLSNKLVEISNRIENELVLTSGTESNLASKRRRLLGLNLSLDSHVTKLNNEFSAFKDERMAEANRRKKISELFRDSNNLAKGGRIEESIVKINEILTLDPENQIALNRKTILEELIKSGATVAPPPESNSLMHRISRLTAKAEELELADTYASCLGAATLWEVIISLKDYQDCDYENARLRVVTQRAEVHELMQDQEQEN